MRHLYYYARALVLVGLLLCLGLQTRAQGTWTAKTSLPAAERYGAVGFSLNGLGYVGTGRNASGGPLADFWAYDPGTNAWSQQADVPGGGRAYAVGFSLNGLGYVGTGTDGLTSVADFWAYDPGANAWSRKADVPGGERYLAVGFGLNDLGYVGTGYPTSGGALADFWAYDPRTNAWSRKADVPGGGRAQAMGFGLDTRGYVGTGFNFGAFADFWAYDPGANAWSRKADFPGGGRLSAVGFGLGDKGYVGTGYAPGGYLADFWAYDPGTNAWTQRADVPGGERQGAVGFGLNGVGYVGTGEGLRGVGITADFWAYSTTTISTSALAASAYCVGSPVSVAFTATGTFAAGNVFTAQLSDASGSFAAPTAIGTLASTTAAPISATLPAGAATGTGYRIRVVGSSPATTGTDNGGNLTLNAKPTPSIAVTTLGKVYTGGVATTLYLGYGPQSAKLAASGGVSYAWSPAAGLSNATSATPVFTATAPGSFTYTVTATNAAGCAATASVTLKVVEARCGKNNKSVQVCDNGTPTCVATSEVNALLTGKTGTYLGACAAGAAARVSEMVAASASPAELSVYPNPAGDQATVLFRTPVDGTAQVVVYNALGQRVASLYEGAVSGGQWYSLRLNSQRLATGLYECRLLVNGQAHMRRLIIAR